MESLGDFEYRLSDVLGHGSYAMVFQGRRKRDALPVAIKKISLKSVPGKLSSIRQEEISILKDLKNTHIVQLHDYLNLGSDIFLVMEFCNGGDMGDYLNAKKTLSENSVRHLIQHIALALEALYKLKIIHRDIKPQNLLLSYPVSSLPHSTSVASASHSVSSSINKQRLLTEATIKLADFGFARHLYGTDMAATLCGSPLYMAPEILVGQKYEHSADLWSVGVILYQCLTGSAPFMATDPHALRKRYKKEALVPKVPAGTSHYLADLLVRLLKKNPKDRLSFYDFFNHSFLKDPSTLFPADSMISHHNKSSPVPIKRQTHPTSSTYSNSPSPKQSVSPHHSSSADTSHFSSPSYSSGPPLSHRIGSQTSLQYYNAQSPNSYSDVTDQGFILVDYPGNSGSRRCSVSSSGGQSSGRNSSAGYTHSGSHAASSVGAGGGNGSLSRYSSLTTPFYQASSVTRTQQQQQQQQQQILKISGNSTPKKSFSPHDATLVQSPDSIPSLISRPSPSNSVPFGRLIKYSSNSPKSSITTTCGSNPPASLLSTPPSSLNSPTAGYVGVGSKCAIARRNSGTKLSALTEEKSQQSNRINQAGKKDSLGEKSNSGGFDIITKSCLLDSEDDIENVSATDDDNFPAGLNMSFTEFEEEERANESVGGVALLGQPYHHHTGQPSPGFQLMPLPNLPANPPLPPLAAPTTTSRRGRPSSSGAVPIRPRRAASFSSGCDLRQDSGSHFKASSLTSGGQESQHRGFSGNMAFPSNQVDEEIVNMAVPFAPSTQPCSTSHPRRSTTTGSMTTDSYKRPSFPSGPNGGVPGTAALFGGGLRRSNKDVSVCLGSLTLAEVRDDLELAEELQAMAKARQGPILLMSTSTSLSDSGVVGRFQRCSEQLVLYGKVLSVLDSLSTRYGLEVALAQEEPPQMLASMMDKVAILRAACLDSAKDIQDEILLAKENGHSLEVRVSAERLLYLEALDMGKAALLDEKSGDQPHNSIRRYRRAALILRHLLSEAHTLHDKQILSKYMQSTEARLRYLQGQLASL